LKINGPVESLPKIIIEPSVESPLDPKKSVNPEAKITKSLLLGTKKETPNVLTVRDIRKIIVQNNDNFALIPMIPHLQFSPKKKKITQNRNVPITV